MPAAFVAAGKTGFFADIGQRLGGYELVAAFSGVGGNEFSTARDRPPKHGPSVMDGSLRP